jgi:hypothetical protein
MNKIAAYFLAVILLGASPFASAEVCDHVRSLAAGAGVGAGVTASQAALAAAPVTTVAHSSGALILTGTAGYVGKTMGLAASAFAVMTAPFTIVAVAGTTIAAGGVVAYCLVTGE